MEIILDYLSWLSVITRVLTSEEEGKMVKVRKGDVMVEQESGDVGP